MSLENDLYETLANIVEATKEGQGCIHNDPNIRYVCSKCTWIDRHGKEFCKYARQHEMLVNICKVK